MDLLLELKRLFQDLEEDGTIKENENIDYVFRKSIRKLELAGITQAIFGIKRRTILWKS